jgi:signal transduction histidine kinase
MQCAATAVTLELVLEGLAVAAGLLISGQPGDSAQFWILKSWPNLLVLALLSLVMLRFRWQPGQKIVEKAQSRLNLPAFTGLVCAVCVILALILAAAANHETFRQPGAADFIMYAALALSFVLILVVLKLKTDLRLKNEAVEKTQQMCGEMDRLFTTIRGQRHDFLNHMQVISSLVQRGKTEELKRYTAELIGEIKEINEIVQIGNPALAAIIQSKIALSADKRIDFRYRFSNLETLSLGVKLIDIVKIAGNLIDNAIEEAEKLPEGERWVEVNGWSENGNLFITVRNPGRLIPKEEIQALFDSGYSTKAEQGHIGIGLAIVKERVEHYKGTISVKSCGQHGTVFTVKIPLQLNFV